MRQKSENREQENMTLVKKNREIVNVDIIMFQNKPMRVKKKRVA